MQYDQDRINKIIIHCSYVIIESKEVLETLRKIHLKLSLWSDQISQEQILGRDMNSTGKVIVIILNTFFLQDSDSADIPYQVSLRSVELRDNKKTD